MSKWTSIDDSLPDTPLNEAIPCYFITERANGRNQIEVTVYSGEVLKTESGYRWFNTDADRRLGYGYPQISPKKIKYWFLREPIPILPQKYNDDKYVK